MEKKYKLFDLPLHLIQNIRFCLSLLEVHSDILVSKSNKDMFVYLADYFDFTVNYVEDHENYEIMDLGFDHSKPEIRINDEKLPLVFPLQMIEYCEKNTNKNIVFSFEGIMTPKRRKTIQMWLKCIAKSPVCIDSVLCKIKEKFNNRFVVYSDKINSIKIIATVKGRKFPIKAWDIDYFERLKSTKFVLCPDGDFIWTYRFFEAIACRAIPIVENVAECYHGFFFYTMLTPIEDIIYSDLEIENNLKLLKEKFTIMRL